MRVELEAVREQHASAQLSAREEMSMLQQQLHTARERVTTLTAEKESEKVCTIVIEAAM